MFLSKTPETTHKCTIKKDSTSCLPKLPPYANYFQRVYRKWKKHLLVSELYLKTKFHFRSKAALFSERRRQVSSYPSYIIHPYSDFIIWREVIMCFCWFMLFFSGPFTATFDYRKETVGVAHTVVYYMETIAIWLLFGNILICFLTGYHNPRTKEIILDPKKIACNYLKTYFIFDLVSYVPFESFLTQEQQELSTAAFVLSGARYIFMYPRIHTMFEYFRNITVFLKIGDALHVIICRIILSLFILHWSACITYFVYDIYLLLDNADNFWIRFTGLYADRYPPSEKYLWCLHMVMINFYRTGVYQIKSRADYCTQTIITLAGVVFHAYIIALVLKVTGAVKAPENQYEELLQQMHQYLRSKNVPLHLCMRLRVYYEHRFQKRYFQERAILSTLSEHLLYEIKLHTCQHLIEKADLFDGLSKSAIGSIIGQMELEVYLTNDVIVQQGLPENYFYIISYGTVAMIHSSGVEVCHLDDGQVFGINSVLLHDNDVNIVAVEICEIFRIPVSKFQKYMSIPSIAYKLRYLVNGRTQLVRNCLSRHESEQKDRQEVLYKVREGKILEYGHLRR